MLNLIRFLVAIGMIFTGSIAVMMAIRCVKTAMEYPESVAVQIGSLIFFSFVIIACVKSVMADFKMKNGKKNV